ncbi:MAG TPA: S8 family serine peptidase [Bacillota bacterium]|nr:S8 family serine peptidase [Bacillota bacterium]
MLVSDLLWVRKHSRKMCPKLRTEVLNNYRPNKWLPCFLQPLVTRWRERYAKINVVIEQHEGCHEAELAGIDAAMKKHNCKVSHQLHLVNGFAGRLNLSSIAELAANPGIKKIWLDREVHAVLDIAPAVVQAPQVWDWGFTGEGITVAVVDTGIYPHPDITSPTNRLIAFHDFVKNKSVAYDDNGHGTHVAGCVAGNGSSSDGRYKGPAPRAGLVGVKVLDRNGSGLLSTVIAGIQWCIEQKDRLGIRVLNLSLGSSAQMGYKEDPVCKAVEKAWQAGIVVVAAAGNEGPEAGSVGSPAIDPMIIAVGASDDNATVDKKDDTLADFSSRGPTIDGLQKPDVIAPGTNITSLAAPGSNLYKTMKNKRVDKNYFTLSGTSMASPICAGVAALLLQANPQLTPTEVKIMLTENAQSIGCSRNEEGSGYVDIYSCIKHLQVSGDN